MASNSKEYNRAYRERPGVKEKQRASMARYRARAKLCPEKVERAAVHRRKASRKRAGVIAPHGETKVGACEICCRVQQLHFDHDHATGLFRGWLCCRCNRALGWYEKFTSMIVRYKKGSKS